MTNAPTTKAVNTARAGTKIALTAGSNLFNMLVWGGETGFFVDTLIFTPHFWWLPLHKKGKETSPSFPFSCLYLHAYDGLVGDTSVFSEPSWRALVSSSILAFTSAGTLLSKS
jgi:hypothetical protein